jgi:uncharacterized membrane protein YcaP (DUF421 family)
VAFNDSVVVSHCSRFAIYIFLLILNGLVSKITWGSNKIETLIEGRPEILIHEGKVIADVMESERMPRHKLNAALRAAGCSSTKEVRYAILENTGQIIIISKKQR